MPFHTGFTGDFAGSLPFLGLPDSLRCLNDVCGKNYDVCGGKTWFGWLTKVEDGLKWQSCLSLET